MTGYFFTNWLTFSLRHPTSSPEDKFFSLLMFIITTSFSKIRAKRQALNQLRRARKLPQQDHPIENFGPKIYNVSRVRIVALRVWYNGITSPFQGEVTGSTPVTRSK